MMYPNNGDSLSHTEHDTKYSVADILSSMAGGQPVISNPTYSHKYTYGGGTQVTPTLTPTTLNNIEQTFIELQNVPNHDGDSSSDQSSSGSSSRHYQSGFVPPRIGPVSETGHPDPDWSPPSNKKSKNSSRTAVLTEADIYTPGYLSTSRKPPQRRSSDKLPPEEQQRRLVRRERNKVAAAKCRQRRVDQTNILLAETDKLDSERNELDNEIQSLQQQKEHLEFLLQAHRPLCKLLGNHDHHHVMTSDGEHLEVKREPREDTCTGGFVEDSVVPYTVAAYKARPNTLSLQFKTPTTSAALGIPITTPSSGIFNFGLDHIADGHTGLTPLTGISSCSTQHNRNGDQSPDHLNSPTLMAL